MPDNTRQAQPETVALFVSDIHLHQSRPKTAQAFFDFLQQAARHTRQLYILGDLFEYWAGDDDLDADFHRAVTGAIATVADSGVEVFWIAGNRDFLLGDGFARASSAASLPDPHVVVIGGRRIVLTHGDAQCTDDRAYIAFREQVRDPEWQRQFLALPLERRKQMIEGFRTESREAARMKSADVMDVHPAAISALLEENKATVIIHGHTHRPDLHEHEAAGQACQRYVLPDWEYDSGDMHGGWIAIATDGNIRRFDAAGKELQSA